MQSRVILITIMAFLFGACNQNERPENNASEKHDAHSEAHNSHPEALSLNNGAKWQTDESTRLHAAKLISEVEVFKKNTSPNLANYQSFAGTIQTELNSLIKDCKMTGPEHEALHHWLEPVLQDVNLLSKATSEEEAKPLSLQLTENILKYNQYFN